MILLGYTFGFIVSSQNWEPFDQAHNHLVETFSQRRDIYAKYKHIIDRVEFSTPPTDDRTFVNSIPDTLNKGVQKLLRITYNIFVDDSLFANVASIIKHAMATNIEALCLVLGFPDELVR